MKIVDSPSCNIFPLLPRRYAQPTKKEAYRLSPTLRRHASHKSLIVYRSFIFQASCLFAFIEQRCQIVSLEFYLQQVLDAPELLMHAAVGAVVIGTVVPALHAFYDEERVFKHADNIVKRKLPTVAAEFISALGASLDGKDAARFQLL